MVLLCGRVVRKVSLTSDGNAWRVQGRYLKKEPQLARLKIDMMQLRVAYN